MNMRNLGIEERLKLVEDLWDSIAAAAGRHVVESLL